MVRWFIATLAFLHAGWNAFDGTRALIVGDFVTPNTGEYAGRLGPWTHLAEAAGIPPRSTAMKCIFAGTGMAWLVGIGAYLAKARWGEKAMTIGSVATIWNLLFGTATNLLILLLLSRERRPKS